MPKAVISLQGRVWQFVINNPENNDIPHTWDGVKYCVWQLEKGKNGTPHLQGTVAWKSPLRLSALRKKYICHWERVRSEDHSVAYCMKEESRVEGPWTIGEPPTPGKRNDLLAVKEKIDKGASMKSIYQEHFETSARHHKFFKEYKRVVTPQRNHKPDVAVLCGPTGTGKSQSAHEQFPGAYWLAQGKWFDDYDAHEDVIIDEFYGWLPYSYMLRLLDRYPMLVETKGGMSQFVAKNIIITSNKEPFEWYDTTKCPIDPLLRRITVVLKKETLEGGFIKIHPKDE